MQKTPIPAPRPRTTNKQYNWPDTEPARKQIQNHPPTLPPNHEPRFTTTNFDQLALLRDSVTLLLFAVLLPLQLPNFLDALAELLLQLAQLEHALGAGQEFKTLHGL